MLTCFPKQFAHKALGVYVLTLMLVSILFMDYAMSWMFVLAGFVLVLSFFYGSNALTLSCRNLSEQRFVKKIFWTAFFLRLVWVVFSYYFYIEQTGQPFEWEAADSFAYHENGEWGAINFRKGNFDIPNIFGWLGVSDMGYSTYLSIIYVLTGDSILITRILKAFWGAWTVVLVYKVASRNFGVPTGRLAAVFCAIYPNLIYYCGLHLKETEMVFLTVAFIERADYILRSKRFSLINMLKLLLVALLLFTFRTVLGAAALFALFSALLLSSRSVLNKGKRIITAIWVVLAASFFVGGNIAREVEEIWEGRNENQELSMEWRSQREGGNAFAKYATASLFAPAIFVIPVSSMVNIVGQENQQFIHGGNFVKNILSFFIYFVLIWIIRNKKWRDFVLLESFLIGYLGIIALSAFAQSERFHQPILPVYLCFVALGLSKMTNKSKRYFNWYIVGVVAVAVAWNYIKLAGRGLY